MPPHGCTLATLTAVLKFISALKRHSGTILLRNRCDDGFVREQCRFLRSTAITTLPIHSAGSKADLEEVCEKIGAQWLRISTLRDKAILLTHYPPLVEGLFPKKSFQTPAFEAVARLIQDLRPILIVQGHEHFWFDLVERLELGDRTALIINPGRRGMAVNVDSDDATAEIER